MSWCFLVLLLYTLWEPCGRFSPIYCFLPIKKKNKDKVDRNLDTMYLAACLHASLGCQL